MTNLETLQSDITKAIKAQFPDAARDLVATAIKAWTSDPDPDTGGRLLDLAIWVETHRKDPSAAAAHIQTYRETVDGAPMGATAFLASAKSLGHRATAQDNAFDAMVGLEMLKNGFQSDPEPLEASRLLREQGMLLNTLSQISGDRKLLPIAVKSLQDALKNLTRDDNPMDWAISVETMATIGVQISTQLPDPAAKTKTLTQVTRDFTTAQQVWHDLDDNRRLGQNAHYLGLIYAQLAESDAARTSAHLAKSVENYERALEVLDPETASELLEKTRTRLADIKTRLG